jgi:hypothetical protein
MTMHNDEMGDYEGDYEVANHVVEFDPGHRDRLAALAAVKGGARWIPSMTATLERLDTLCRDQHPATRR